MTSGLGSPRLGLLAEFTGEIIITIPVTCAGAGCDAAVSLYIYEGSWLPTRGTLLAKYCQEVHFDEGETKEVSFRHRVIQTGESRRDVGLEIVVNGEIVASAQWDDVYSVPGAPGGLDMLFQMLPLVMMGTMMLMLMPMLEEGQ